MLGVDPGDNNKTLCEGEETIARIYQTSNKMLYGFSETVDKPQLLI